MKAARYSRNLRNDASPTGAIRMNVLALPSTRRPASQRRRAPQIIEAAARVFAERGFHGATTQDIADVLGIRQASLYYYFSSKEAALELVCIKGVEGFFEAAKVNCNGSRHGTEAPVSIDEIASLAAASIAATS